MDPSLEKLSAVLRSARKRHGYSQNEFARALKTTQGTLSKIENAQLTVDAHTWFDACDILKIPPHSLRAGLIDIAEPGSVQSVERLGKYRIPKKYGAHAGSTVRSALPFLQFFEKCEGGAGLREYLESKKLDPDYFVQLNNPINLRFIVDLVGDMDARGTLKARGLKSLASHFTTAPIHRSTDVDLSKTDPLDALASILANLPKYESNHVYSLEEVDRTTAVYSVSPRDHLKELGIPASAMQILCRYRESAIGQLASKGSGSLELRVWESECSYKGAPKCVHRAEIVS